MTPDDLLAHYKSQVSIAKAAGITQPSVAEWFDKGFVPETRQYQFEVLSGGKLRADRTMQPAIPEQPTPELPSTEAA